jgi:hypothetical protein
LAFWLRILSLQFQVLNLYLGGKMRSIGYNQAEDGQPILTDPNSSEDRRLLNEVHALRNEAKIYGVFPTIRRSDLGTSKPARGNPTLAL